MGQTCRICGIHVSSGFTNCDSCYDKFNIAEAYETMLLNHVSKRGTTPTMGKNLVSSNNEK